MGSCSRPTTGIRMVNYKSNAVSEKSEGQAIKAKRNSGFPGKALKLEGKNLDNKGGSKQKEYVHLYLVWDNTKLLSS
jgi:hypothetical protein